MNYPEDTRCYGIGNNLGVSKEIDEDKHIKINIEDYAAYLDPQDVELLIKHLFIIREYQQRGVL